jgi:hypothetical protein
MENKAVPSARSPGFPRQNISAPPDQAAACYLLGEAVRSTAFMERSLSDVVVVPDEQPRCPARLLDPPVHRSGLGLLRRAARSAVCRA